jgi:hypothetical protein
MLACWRHLPKNDIYFLGDIGLRFKEQMKLKKAKLSEAEVNRISKMVGLGKYKGRE